MPPVIKPPAAPPVSELERQLRALVEALPAAIYTTDPEGRITFYNKAAAALAGREPVIGRDEWCVTWRLYAPDGTPLAHDSCPMAVALRENRPVRGVEAVAERPDGTRVPFLPFPTPLRDEQGRLIGAVNMLVDISPVKAAEAALRASEERCRQLNETLEARVAERTRELQQANDRLKAEVTDRERAEAQLQQAQKMEAVGQLASGMAHDFNNLLTAILGNLELVESHIADERLLRMIRAATKAAERGAELNAQMLAFSRKQHLAPQTVDLGSLVSELRDMLQRTLGGTIEVTTEAAADLWRALVDPTQIELVILNLAINARDAMPAGGTVRIGARNVKAAELANGLGLPPGDYVCVFVGDDGIGMSEQVLARACEPFFTTKQPGKGSGLGLSQVYGVARQSGGDMTIESAVGQGTTVSIYLPRSLVSAGDGAASLAPRPTEAEINRSLTALVVDDQPEVREVAATHLDALGYRVLEAESGKAALDRFAAGAEVDIMVADYAMAEMNGIELAHAVLERRPELPIVMMTGYLDVGDLDQKLRGAVLLKKPYRLSELAAAVSRARHPDPGGAKVLAFRRR